MPAYVRCPKCDTKSELPLLRTAELAGVDMTYEPFRCKKCSARISGDQALTYEMLI